MQERRRGRVDPPPPHGTGTGDTRTANRRIFCESSASHPTPLLQKYSRASLCKPGIPIDRLTSLPDDLCRCPDPRPRSPDLLLLPRCRDQGRRPRCRRCVQPSRSPLIFSAPSWLTLNRCLLRPGGIGQPLSLLLKQNPLVTKLSLFDIRGCPGVASDVSHVNTPAVVRCPLESRVSSGPRIGPRSEASSGKCGRLVSALAGLQLATHNSSSTTKAGQQALGEVGHARARLFIDAHTEAGGGDERGLTLGT